jgi:DNA topoisomerase-1
MQARHSAQVSNVFALEVQSRAAARSAGLRYVDDAVPGIRRERKRRVFHYFDAKGRRIVDERLLARIRALAIPPAWTAVWICPYEDGHLQCTGRDARGRKQYRYHRRWSEVRDAAKHGRICAFAEKLEAVRAHCRSQLRTRGLTRDKVLAAMLCVVDRTAIRIGNEEYTRDNASFGLTTLRTRHARVRGSRVELRFRGKSGVQRHLSFEDPALAKVIAACRALGGPRLFQYRDEHGRKHNVDSAQLNRYLRTLAGPNFSVKDFRTWAATVRVAVELRGCGPAQSERAARKQLLVAIRSAAEHLGNTPSICRKSYIHPLIMNAYIAGKTLPAPRTAAASASDYRAHELAVRRFLLRLIRDCGGKPPGAPARLPVKLAPARAALKQAS